MPTPTAVPKAKGARPNPVEWARQHARPKSQRCWICRTPEAAEAIRQMVDAGGIALPIMADYLREHLAYPLRDGAVGNHVRQHMGGQS